MIKKIKLWHYGVQIRKLVNRQTYLKFMMSVLIPDTYNYTKLSVEYHTNIKQVDEYTRKASELND